MRTQVAVFVDAGYLFALGSMALTGSALPRARVGVNTDELMRELKDVMREVIGEKPLLRIYWYETNTQNRVMSNEYLRIGEKNDFKLRLSSLHQQNVRTATATLIARDLVELSKNGAISDALLLARNDTLRTGVEMSQSHGVKVHMLEIFTDDDSQFSWLTSDVDTCTPWRSDVLGRFLFEQDPPMESETFPLKSSRPSEVSDDNTNRISRPTTIEETDVSEATRESIRSVVRDFIDELYDDELDSCMEYWRTGRGVPNAYDKSLLFECRNVLDRNLSDGERQEMRNVFRVLVTERVQNVESGLKKIHDAEESVESFSDVDFDNTGEDSQSEYDEDDRYGVN